MDTLILGISLRNHFIKEWKGKWTPMKCTRKGTFVCTYCDGNGEGICQVAAVAFQELNTYSTIDFLI